MPPTEGLRVNGQRLWDMHMEMAAIGALSHGGNCRLGLTDEDRRGRDLFASWCRKAGCEMVVDHAGNMFATRPGRRKAPPVTAGSHLDTQPHGGRFDGIFGVLAAMEAVQTIAERGIETDLPVAVVNWTNEEGVRFPAVLGSAAYLGRWSAEALADLRGSDGARFGDELSRIGYAGTIAPGAFAMESLFEPHIEQGPILEGEGQVIGVVTGIQGLRWLAVEVEGADRHAGTTPMPARRDSLVAAARMVVGFDALARRHEPDARVTVGRLDVDPNSPSTIAGATRFLIDIRHPDTAMLDRLEAEATGICEEAAAKQQVKVAVKRIIDIPPVVFDEACVNLVASATRHLGYSHRRMISGAIHDASNISRLLPTAMIFIPSRDGISHNEAEYSAPAHVEAGANVLLHAMLARAGG